MMTERWTRTGRTLRIAPRWAVCVLALSLATAGCRREVATETTSSESSSPVDLGDFRNIVLISIDTLRADHLACYGHEFVKTPSIDGLAQEGIRFTHAFAPASTTLASHTSMMTGTYPHTHGVARNRHRVPDENDMLPERLKAIGFTTSGFVAAAPLATEVNFAQGFDYYDADFGQADTRGKSKRSAERTADKVTDAVLAWLEQRTTRGTSTTDEHERLFLFVHYYDPHWPYIAPPPYERMYRTDALTADGSMTTIAYVRGLLRQAATGDGENDVPKPKAAPAGTREELVKVLRAEYAAEVSYCDHHVGRLLDGLARHDLFDTSLIILTSDHGETLDEHHDSFSHGNTVYDTEIRIPLIVRFPEGATGRRTVSRLTTNIDIAPTILDLLGLPSDTAIEGQSFAEVIQGGPGENRTPVFAEATQIWGSKDMPRDPVWPNNDNFQCVRTLDHKYLFRVQDNQSGFYDLARDPLEQTNLLQGEKTYDAELLAGLRTQLIEWRQDLHPLGTTDIKSKKHIDALRDLGYVGGAEDKAHTTDDDESPRP